MLTIPGSLRSTARRVPGDPALAFGDRAYTYAELDAAVDRTAGALAALALEGEVGDAVIEADYALILYTSGTTGLPKGALFDHHRVMWAGFTFVASCGMRVGDRFLHVAPLYHAAELGIMLIPSPGVPLAKPPDIRGPRG